MPPTTPRYASNLTRAEGTLDFPAPTYRSNGGAEPPKRKPASFPFARGPRLSLKQRKKLLRKIRESKRT